MSCEECKKKDSEIERLNKMRTHCENCGADYMATGIESGCPCLLKAERDELRATVERLKQDAHNLRSPVHAICNQNLTEALAAAIEQTQTIARLKAPVSDQELRKHFFEADTGGHFLCNLEAVDALIASRSVPQEGQPASNQEGTE